MPTFPGETIDGEPAANWPEIQRECAKHNRFDITVEKHDPEREITRQQQKMFYATVLPTLSEWNGDDKEEWKNRLKLVCGSQWFKPTAQIIQGVAYTIIPSMTTLKVSEFNDWYESIRQYCEKEHGVILPVPDKNWKTKGK